MEFHFFQTLCPTGFEKLFADLVLLLSQKKSSKKLISKVVSKAFQLIFYQIQSFYDKSYFYFSFKQFWAIENSKPFLEKFENINCKANAKAISRFDFSTL